MCFDHLRSYCPHLFPSHSHDGPPSPALGPLLLVTYTDVCVCVRRESPNKFSYISVCEVVYMGALPMGTPLENVCPSSSNYLLSTDPQGGSFCLHDKER